MSDYIFWVSGLLDRKELICDLYIIPDLLIVITSLMPKLSEKKLAVRCMLAQCGFFWLWSAVWAWLMLVYTVNK